MNALASQFAGVRLTPARAAPASASRRGVVCVASATAETGRLPAAKVKKVTFDGKAAGEATMHLHSAPEDSAKGLVHRYLVMVRQNARRGTASTLTRSEVSGGGKKPFAQKGTGNARQGSSRTPLRPGGGVAFGPKPRDWSIKMNKKEKRLAMATALQSAASSITVVEDITTKHVPEYKTKVVADALKSWGVNELDNALLITKEVVDTVAGSARNIGNLAVAPVNALNVYDVLRADKLIIEASALEHLNGWFGPEGKAWE